METEAILIEVDESSVLGANESETDVSANMECDERIIVIDSSEKEGNIESEVIKRVAACDLNRT
jgi:hypothetical protein